MARTAGRPRKPVLRIVVSAMDAALEKLKAQPLAGMPDLDYVKSRAELWDARFAENRTIDEIAAFIVSEVPDMTSERATTMVSAAYREHRARVTQGEKKRKPQESVSSAQSVPMIGGETDKGVVDAFKPVEAPASGAAAEEAFTKMHPAVADEELTLVPQKNVEPPSISGGISLPNRERELGAFASKMVQQPAPKQGEPATHISAIGNITTTAASPLFRDRPETMAGPGARQVASGSKDQGPFLLRSDAAREAAQTVNTRHLVDGASPSDPQEGRIHPTKPTGIIVGREPGINAPRTPPPEGDKI